MKKYIVLLLFFGMTTLLSAQNFFGGVIAGINASQVDGDNFSGYKKAGFNGGGFVGYQFTRRSGLRFGIEFSQKGARQNPKYDENGNLISPNAYTFLFRENCIDIPVAYMFYLNRLFVFEGGLSYTYIFNAMRSYDDTGSNDMSDIKKNSINMLLGVNVNITKHLFANLRFSYGLTPIGKATTQLTRGIFGVVGQYNNVFTLSLGWNFGKGNKF
ncbi:MAG: porin family protein [Bacteroidales bacterium]|nr:porin family protein [Bacteroidales bacterium]